MLLAGAWTALISSMASSEQPPLLPLQVVMVGEIMGCIVAMNWSWVLAHFFTASISVTVGDLDKASPVIRIASAVSVDAESLMASSIRVLTRLSNESPAYF